MSTPGDWWIELDDGTGAERRPGAERRHTTIDGGAHLDPGEELQGLLYGRHWRIDRVDHGLRWAVAVPDDLAPLGEGLSLHGGDDDDTEPRGPDQGGRIVAVR